MRARFFNSPRPSAARDPVSRPVGDADIARLALPHDGVEGLQRLVERGLRVVAVQLVEINVVGAEAAQRSVDRIEDVLARHALIPGLRAHIAGAFGAHE